MNNPGKLLTPHGEGGVSSDKSIIVYNPLLL